MELVAREQHFSQPSQKVSKSSSSANSKNTVNPAYLLFLRQQDSNRAQRRAQEMRNRADEEKLRADQKEDDYSAMMAFFQFQHSDS
jgi:hypothetical protein